MDVREKLVELLTDNLPRCGNLPRWDNPLQLSCDEQVQRIADHLIMNGVTPVVRCKDCKWLYDEMGDYCCRSHRGLVRICENSICSCGERKEDK